jgi:mono/diheme cytochrome c family protein
MKKIMVSVLLSLLIFFVSYKPASFAGAPICGPQGEYLFKKHCSGCHRDPARLKQVEDIASQMRNPPVSMPQFGKDKISDIDAGEIADYIHLVPVDQLVAKTNSAGNAR